MCEPSDARSGGGKELHHKPEQQHDDRRYLDDSEQQDRHRTEDARSWPPHEVCAHECGDRSRGSDYRCGRCQCECVLHCSRDQSARKVKDDEPPSPQTILNVVAEDPKEQQVSAEMPNRSVQKQCKERCEPYELAGKHLRFSDGWIECGVLGVGFALTSKHLTVRKWLAASDFARDTGPTQGERGISIGRHRKPVGVERGRAAVGLERHKDQHVEAHEHPNNDGPSAGRIEIAQRNDHGLGC